MSVSVIEEDDNVIVARLNGNKANVLTTKFIDEICDWLDTLESDEKKKHKGLVFVGNNKAFSAGLDLNLMMNSPPDVVIRYVEKCDRFFSRIFHLARPVVAAVNGHAIAGGCGLAAACDFRLSNGKGKHGMNETANGIMIPFRLVQILKHALPAKTAWKWILSGALYSAQEAHNDGFFDGIYENETDLIEAAVELASFEPNQAEIYKQEKQMLQKKYSDLINNNPNATMKLLQGGFNISSKM